MAYKLTYFDTAGRGEHIRFLLSYGGIDFEDKRIDKADWPALKPNTPFGQVPIIEYEGKISHQSIAICRYVAKKVKLVGNDDWEDLEIDAAVDSVAEMQQKVATHRRAAPEVTLKELMLKEDVKDYLKKLDKQIEKNNGYLALGRLTWADLVFAPTVIQSIHRIGSDAFADYPSIQANAKKVAELPKIKEWLEKHPPKE